jgi:hypothetical protein
MTPESRWDLGSTPGASDFCVATRRLGGERGRQIRDHGATAYAWVRSEIRRTRRDRAAPGSDRAGATALCGGAKPSPRARSPNK